MYRVETLKPKEPASVHCSQCAIYNERLEFAEAMESYFHHEFNWDYTECYQACERERRLKVHDCNRGKR